VIIVLSDLPAEYYTNLILWKKSNQHGERVTILDPAQVAEQLPSALARAKPGDS
jgi:hypothetical protein